MWHAPCYVLPREETHPTQPKTRRKEPRHPPPSRSILQALQVECATQQTTRIPNTPSSPMKIPIRVVDNPKAAKICGWSKNHRLIQMYVACNWRDVGFFTLKQIAKGAWRVVASRKIRLNASYAGPIEFDEK